MTVNVLHIEIGGMWLKAELKGAFIDCSGCQHP